MNWPHAPTHRLKTAGTYMVTGATHYKRPHLAEETRKEGVMLHLFALADYFEWELQAWAILNNHYHFIASSPENPDNLPEFINCLHRDSAMAFNCEDQAPGRQIWFQYWESQITYHKSYMTRLNYVHNNPEKHGLCTTAENYRWCSKAWHLRTSTESFRRTLDSFKADRLNVIDDFDDDTGN